jgi:hypothetical protein
MAAAINTRYSESRLGSMASASTETETERRLYRSDAGHRSEGSGMDDAEDERRREAWERGTVAKRGPGRPSAGSGVDDADGERRNGESVHIRERRSRQDRAEAPRPSADSGFWDDAELIPCLDGKSRRVEPGTPPLVDGFPGRVGQLRAYGNAISPQVAAGFVKAYLMGRYHGICENTL